MTTHLFHVQIAVYVQMVNRSLEHFQGRFQMASLSSKTNIFLYRDRFIEYAVLASQTLFNIISAAFRIRITKCKLPHLPFYFIERLCQSMYRFVVYVQYWNDESQNPRPNGQLSMAAACFEDVGNKFKKIVAEIPLDDTERFLLPELGFLRRGSRLFLRENSRPRFQCLLPIDAEFAYQPLLCF